MNVNTSLNLIAVTVKLEVMLWLMSRSKNWWSIDLFLMFRLLTTDWLEWAFKITKLLASSNCWFCLEMFKIQHQGIHIILDWSWYYETCRLRDGARNGIKLFFSSTFQINPIFRYKGFLSCSKNSSFDVHPVLMGLINQNLILIIAKITKQWNSPFHNHSPQ